METVKRGYTQAAMQYGTQLGVLWIAAFAVYIAALTMNGLSLLFIAMLVASPIYAGYLGIRYRKRECGNRISFINAWAFMIIVYLCASALAAIACYIYFRFMDNGMALSIFKEQIDIYTAMEIGDDLKKAFGETYEMIAKMSASDICMQYLTSNLFISSILAPLTSIFITKR